MATATIQRLSVARTPALFGDANEPATIAFPFWFLRSLLAAAVQLQLLPGPDGEARPLDLVDLGEVARVALEFLRNGDQRLAALHAVVARALGLGFIGRRRLCGIGFAIGAHLCRRCRIHADRSNRPHANDRTGGV